MRRLRFLLQVHGTRVARPDDPAARPQADAWVGSPEPGVLLGLLTADCLPVLLCHPDSRVLGLAHAGWRGAAAGVVVNTLKSTGVPTDQVRAVVGPGIGSCCYEVGEDVARAVGEQSPHLLPGREAGRFRLDLKGLVRSQLMGAGVVEERIQLSALCTACRADLFFSYRRGRDTGRLCAFLGWAAS